LVDPATGDVVYVNGGHEAPVISGPGGVRTRLAPTGPAVGMLPGLPFNAGRDVIAVGETLVAFTDGVTDAVGADGARYSEERLLALLSSPAGSAPAALQRIRADVPAGADAEPFDDIT